MRCLLFFLRNKKSANYCQAGFTLLELLIVISLLGLISGMAILSLNDVSEQSRADATQFEMAEIRKALLQFRRDSGSRDFPGQGVYDCDDDPTPNVATTTLNPAIIAQLPSHVTALATEAEKVAWCKHPANFWMLFQNPLANGWNADTKRGWNGPYLQRKSGYLDIGDDLTPDALGSPILGTPIENIWGIADPNIKPFMTELDGDEHLAWRTTLTQINAHDSHGRPYLLFGMDTDASTATDDDRIVSLSENGDYDGIGIEPCLSPLDPDTSEAMDSVLCLLQ